MLKKVFGPGKDLQEEVISLSKMFNNRFDNFVNTSNKEDIISRHQTGNAISPWLPGIGRNRVAGNFQMQKGALERNKIAGQSER